MSDIVVPPQANDNGQLASLRSQYPQIAFIIARSKNLNIVVYEGNVVQNALSSSAPINVFWLDIDPEYVKANRAKGVNTDRQDLGYIERTMAYGLSSEAVSGRSGYYHIKLVAFPTRIVTVHYDTKTKQTVATMMINGAECVIIRIYVHARERTLQLPKVEFVDLHGVGADGRPVSERIIPK